MSGRLRLRTRAQAENRITVSQKGFLGGLNTRLPASSIDATQVSELENMIPFRDRVESRTGVKKYSNTTFPSGDLKFFKYIGNTFQFICQVGNNVYYADSSITSWILISSSVTDTIVKAQPLGNTSIILTGGSNLYRIDSSVTLTNVSLRIINGTNPIYNASSGSAESNHTYRYRFTYVRLTDESNVAQGTGVQRNDDGIVVNAESGANTSPSLDNDYYQKSDSDYEVGDGVNFTLNNYFSTPPTTEEWTHFGIYRTFDIGTDEQNELNQPVDNVEQYVWVGDMAIADGSFTDSTKDSVLEERAQASLNLRTKNYKPIPVYNTSILTKGYLFTANPFDSGVSKITYCQTDETLGFYNPLMFDNVDGVINDFGLMADRIAVFTSKHTYVKSLYGESNGGVEEIGEYSPILPDSSLADNNLTVFGAHSVVEDNYGGLVVFCNDKSLRTFDGSTYSKNYGYEVQDKLDETAIVTLAFSKEGYVLLWYSESTLASQLSFCLRLGFKEESGIGWSVFSGTNFPVVSSSSFISPTIYDKKIIMPDNTETYAMWINTFGTDIVHTDDSLDIICKIKTREYIGSREELILRHLSTYCQWRPYSASYLSGIEIKARIYTDGNSTYDAEAVIIPKNREVSFDKRITCNRIQFEFITNKASISLLGLNNILTSADSNTFDVETTERDYQKDISSGLSSWISRISLNTDYVKDLANGSFFSGLGAVYTTGVNSISNAIDLDATQISKALSDTSGSNGDISLLFGVKLKDATAKTIFYLTATGTTDLLLIQANSDTEITITLGANVSVFTVSSLLNWSTLLLERRSGVWSLYQDYSDGDSSITPTSGTFTNNADIGGGNIIYYNDISVFDARLYLGKTLDLVSVDYMKRNIDSFNGVGFLPNA